MPHDLAPNKFSSSYEMNFSLSEKKVNNNKENKTKTPRLKKKSQITRNEGNPHKTTKRSNQKYLLKCKDKFF